MKLFTRTASVVWAGSHQHGEGAITTQSAILKKAPYVSGNHLERGKGTNPPELIAAAHASSFSMALANELGHAGYSPEQIDTTATVTMELIAAGWTMTGIHLDVVAWVLNADHGPAREPWIVDAIHEQHSAWRFAPSRKRTLFDERDCAERGPSL